MTERPPNEMVERVARAMAENAGFCWEHCAQSQWRSDALAGIKAMRKPTEYMVTVGWSLIRGNLRPDEIYPHMIDAALGDGESGTTSKEQEE